MKQTLIVFVQDEPGVLNRVSSYIRRKLVPSRTSTYFLPPAWFKTYRAEEKKKDERKFYKKKRLKQ